jgi:hypothetical protein
MAFRSCFTCISRKCGFAGLPQGRRTHLVLMLMLMLLQLQLQLCLRAKRGPGGEP